MYYCGVIILIANLRERSVFIYISRMLNLIAANVSPT